MMVRCEVRRTPHRFGWQVASDGGQYVASCYHEQRYQQAREFQQQGTQVRLRGRLEMHHTHLGFLSSTEFELKRRTRCTSTNTLGVVTLLQETVNTTDGELKTSLGRSGLSLARGFSRGLAGLGLAASLSRHCC